MSESTLAVMQPVRLAPIQPHTFEDIQKYAMVMSESDLVPKDYKGKPANVCVAIIMGRELGVPPMQALQGIAVINGRPSVWGDLMWALVTGHPDFEDAQESVDDTKASCILKRRGRSAVTEEFTQSDAQKAGLWGKAGPWAQYPKRMMLWRARTFAARNLFADALKGIQIREEVMDYIDGEVTPTPAREMVAFAHPDAGTKNERKPETIKAQTVETKAAEPAQTAEPDTITPAQGTAWNKARKASGYTTEEASEYLKEKHGGIERTGQILAKNFDDAMRWAQTPKQQESPEEAGQSDDEKLAEECNGYWDRLNASESERMADVKKFTDANEVIDWNNLSMELHSRVQEIL